MQVSAKSIDQLDAWARGLLESARVGHLGLVDEGEKPRVLPVTFAIHRGAAWTAIDRKPKRSGREPARVRYLRRRSEATLLADRYDDDWSRLAWVQLTGRARVVSAGDAPEALDVLAAKYAQYRDDPPPGPLIAVEPERIVTWRA